MTRCVAVELGEFGIRVNSISPGPILTGIFAKLSQSEESFSNWKEQQTRQFQTLTHPDHLGRAFRVFIQRRP